MRLALARGYRRGVLEVTLNDLYHEVERHGGPRLTNGRVLGNPPRPFTGLRAVRQEVTRELLRSEARTTPEQIADDLHAVLTAAPSTPSPSNHRLADVVRLVGETDFARLQQDPLYRTWLAIVALAVSGYGEAERELLGELSAYHQTFVDSICLVYEMAIDGLGIKLRSGFSLRQFAEVAAALGAGLALNSRWAATDFHADVAVDDRPATRWHLYSLGLYAVSVLWFEPEPK
jgi:hypothetical protein